MRLSKKEMARQYRRDMRVAVKVAPETAPGYMQTIPTAILVAVAQGRVNLNALALDELASRGLGPETGEWVGFDMARKLCDAVKDDRCFNTTPKA